MTTTALLHGLRIAQHLVTEAASYGIKFSTVTTYPAGDVAVHLDRTNGAAFASHLVDTLGLDIVEVWDYPDSMNPFRQTAVVYRGTRVALYGSMPADADKRPEPPTYTATDVTGWDPEDIGDMRDDDRAVEDAYQGRLVAWLARHPEVAVAS